ncbi:aminopeptidase C [Penicillium sp. IBT 18751x]|nr:aminopeptidase C [Penicillium sp. IBT 18751x]
MSLLEQQYGLWESPLTKDILASQKMGASVQADEARSLIYILETDSEGCQRISKLGINNLRDESILPSPYRVGTRVFEYGGGAWTIDKEGNIIFSDSFSNAICILDTHHSTVKKIFEDCHHRFADFDSFPLSTRWVIANREDHRDAILPTGVRNSLVLIDTQKAQIQTLDDEYDFYSHMRFSPDGQWLSWLSWNHPHMPFTGACLYTARFQDHDGKITHKRMISGEPGVAAISQPRWANDGALYFLNDTSGFWQLYVLRPSSKQPEHISMDGLEDCDLGSAEFGLGSCSFQFLGAHLVYSYTRDATNYVALANLQTGECHKLDLQLIHIHPDSVKRVQENAFVLIGETLSEVTAMYHVTIYGESLSNYRIAKIWSSLSKDLPIHLISMPRPLCCPRTHGPFRDGLVHGFIYQPASMTHRAPFGTLPPLLVYAHGGPTNHAHPGYSLETQYWTSRGYALLLLNYAGSTGYGKQYRNRLYGNWGIADSSDACSAVKYLVESSIVDGTRIGIIGPSAGGYLALKVVCDEPDLWAASVSLFGISDTGKFAESTHKFESHYADLLIFGRDCEVVKEDRVNAVKLHKERSPIHNADRIKTPILLLQGAEDWVVRPQQALMMREILREKGKVSETIMFPGAGHSYWKGKTLEKSLDAQKLWWKRYLLRV